MDPCTWDMERVDYSLIHLFVLEENIQENIPVIEMLIEEGEDLTKQERYNGFTALHVFLNEKPYYRNKKVHELIGKLGKNPVVDFLLSEQVKKNIALNPKCFDGISHLHIACMVDHSQAVELFLKAGESVNEAVSPDNCMFAGWTPLHFAIKHSSIATCNLLFYHGADIHMKDAVRNTSPLHRLMKRLLDAMDCLTMGKRGPATPIIKEIKMLEKIACSILSTRKTNDINFEDDRGITPLHVTCTMRDSFMTQDILKGDIDINKPLNNKYNFWSGRTALHFAACCSVETVKLLVQNGGDMTIKDAKGETPLDLCMMRFSPKEVHSILSLKEEFKEILLSDQVTKLLDLVLAMDNCDKFNNFLQNLSDVNITVPLDSPIWPGYNVCHLAVSMHERVLDPTDYIEQLVHSKNTPEVYTCTEEQEKIYWKRIVVCLARQCSLTAKNADGMTPIHVAFKLNKANVVDKLLNCCQTNETNSDGLSFLHMACVIGKKSIVERFISDMNDPVKKSFKWQTKKHGLAVQADSTSLHIAVLFDHRDIVKYLLEQKNIDVYARDWLGFTPVHLSIESVPMSFLFFEKITNLKEIVSIGGLSHLHVAAFIGSDTAVQKLLSNGANINATFRSTHPQYEMKFLDDFIGLTPLHIAVKLKKSKVICVLIEAGADIHAVSLRYKYDTPLQAAMRLKPNNMIQYFLKKLRRDKRTKEPIEECGVTLLHFACAVFDRKWAQRLLEKGANPNAQLCIDEDYWGDWKGLTPLHVLLIRAYFLDKEIRNLAGMVRLLLRHGADVTLQDQNGISPLLCAEELDDTEKDPKQEEVDSEPEDEGKTNMRSIADLLLKNQQSYAVDPVSADRSTHFQYACKRNKIEIVKKFLKNGVDVNRAKAFYSRNNGGFTPLHFAFANRCFKVAELLLEHNADVNAKDYYGNTPLHVAAKFNVDDVLLLEMMHKMGANFKTKNFDRKTPLDFLIMSDCISYDELKFFVDHGCLVEMRKKISDKGVLGLLLHNGRPHDREAILKLLIESCNLIEQIQNGFDAIKNLVSVTPNPHHSEYRLWTVDMYLEGIQLFIDMGCKIYERNSHAITALVEATHCHNARAVEALLLLGVELNAYVDPIIYKPPATTESMPDDQYKNERDRISRLMASYVWKMKFVGLDILPSCDIIAQSTLYSGDTKMEQRCKDELEKMEQIKVGDSWNMKDFLIESKAVMGYQMMSLEKRQSVDEIFKAHANLQKMFPEFCGVLMLQYRKAVSNVGLYWPVRNAVASLLKLELPNECFNTLLRYFKKDYLKIIASSEKHSF